MTRVCPLFLVASALLIGEAAAAEPTVHLELPTVDVAIDGRAGHPIPGMNQSLWIATDAFQLVGFGLGKIADPHAEGTGEKVLGRALVIAGDALLVGMPFGLYWQHEEWHRAVLSRRQIHSFDGVYKFDLLSVAINVSEVEDASLARLKAERPAEFVRMSTAGLEGGYELATNLEKIQFFHRTRTWNVPALFEAYLVNSIYQYACASTLGDSFTDEANKKEGADRRGRDFTGADCVAAAYDLFRPNEPYAARGVHPSGVGVDRYRKYGNGTAEEQRYLRTQFGLSLLNFLDPALLGVVAFTTGGLRWNTHVRYMPTSFGSTLDLDAFLQKGVLGLFVSAHTYTNHERLFPGLTAEILRFPVGRGVHVGGRVGAWLQPAQQGFFDRTSRPGGLLGLKVGYAGSPLAEPYVEVEAKTAGWVAGNVSLEPAFVFRTGLVCRL